MDKTCPRCSKIIPVTSMLCAACASVENKRRGAKSKQHGISTRQWARFRQRVLKRDGYRCRYPGCHAVDRLSVHYIPGGVHTLDARDYVTYCLHHHGVIDAPRAAGRRTHRARGAA